MRVVALISGGKDSCYNAMQCVAAGHKLVALANLQPEGKEDELDSFMFQTVGHEAVELVAQAMGLPLYRSTTHGQSKWRGLHYPSPQEGDEVEDLYHLLERVQMSEDVEGVASGAVLSDYQRLRVEHVCERLGLRSVAYLWRRDQTQLLTDMTEAGLTAVLIKVAAIGLTQDHLGKTLRQMKAHLAQLHGRYDVHMCGEGGEYETLTLDCPLFTHHIVIDESEVVMVTEDDLAPVAYLKLKRLHLEKKCPSVQRPLPPLPAVAEMSLQMPQSQTSCGVCDEKMRGEEGREEAGWMWRCAVFEGVGGDVLEQTHHLFSQLTDWLRQCGCGEVALIHLYLSSMADYPVVNSIYHTHYHTNPPARVCVQLSLPPGVLVKMEVLAVRRREEGEGKELVAMHVQSVSCWAPANIGPYSQAVRGGGVVVTAGQIGLDPPTMSLATPPQQPALALSHVTAVLAANHTHVTSALCGVCYYTTEEAGWAARKTWSEELTGCGLSGRGPAVVFVRVPGLPRGACVEWSFISLTPSPSSHLHREHPSLPPSPSLSLSLSLSLSPSLPPSLSPSFPLSITADHSACEVRAGVGMVSGEVVTWRGGGGDGGDGGEMSDGDDGGEGISAGAWLVTLTPPPTPLRDVSEAVSVCVEEMERQLAVAGVAMHELTQLRLFIPRYSSNLLKLSGVSGVEVAVVVCEGYFGQNCSVALLALLLPPQS